MTTRFTDFGLDPAILRALSERGYETPTPIQAQAIPVVLSGRDVMGGAQTGTGKTAGFALPIIQRLLPHASASVSPARHPIRALILTPTRELADQVADNVAYYSSHTPLKSLVIFGGVDMNPQTTALRAGVEILIATPGRLLDHVQQKTVNLSQTQILVLDEADRMLDMGFLPDLQRIVNLLPKQRQSLMFSATFSPEIKKLANSFLKDPLLIEVSRQNSTSENIQQIGFEVADHDKRAAVAHIILSNQLKQVIVFVNTKIGCGRLARSLIAEGLKAGAIHGDKSQGERMEALEAFKNGTIEVLVATDVAARGLDIAELPAVINYDLPHAAEDYIHRSGRTGRAGALGVAYSLITPHDARNLAEIEKLIKKPLERGVLPPLAKSAHEVESRSGRGFQERGKSTDTFRSGRNDSSRNSAEPRATRSYNAPMRAAKNLDPLFSQPYQPSSSTSSSAQLASTGDSTSGIKRAKPALGALLGGKK